MSNRRIYVNISELNYRALRRIGVYTGECAGMIAERLINEYIGHRILTDESFLRWLEAEQRDITYGNPPPPDIRRNYKLRRPNSKIIPLADRPIIDQND